jgi:hypothetical protein
VILICISLMILMVFFNTFTSYMVSFMKYLSKLIFKISL